MRASIADNTPRMLDLIYVTKSPTLQLQVLLKEKEK